MRISVSFSSYSCLDLNSLNKNESKTGSELNTKLNYSSEFADKKPISINSKLVKVYFSGNDKQKPVTKLDKEIENFRKWADNAINEAKTGKLKNVYVPKSTSPENTNSELSAKELIRNNKTLKLYKEKFNTFMWTGEECSDPIYPNYDNNKEERWDQLELINFYDKNTRQEHLAQLKKLGIENVRLGIPQHFINNADGNLDEFDKTVGQGLKDYSEAGIKISLDLQHFGLPDYMGDQGNSGKSYFLNPKWPDYHAKVAKEIMKKYSNNITAVTLTNEPYVTNLFSGGMWNEKCPGWGSPDFDHFVINRGLLMAEADIKAKIEIEKHLQKQPDNKKTKMIYIHNEALDSRADNETSNKYFRFISSDFILGQDWLLKGDFRKSDMYKWLSASYPLKEYKDDKGNKISDPNQIKMLQREDRQKLEAELTNLKNLHLKLKKETGKTMMDDTVFGVDYYTTNEGGLSQGVKLSSKTEDYAKELKSGKRKGLYGLTKEYWNRYHLPILHTETNCLNTEMTKRPKDSIRWGVQQLLELRQLDKSGIPVLGANWYSFNDQFAWSRFLDISPKTVKENPEQYQDPIGIVNPVTKKERPVGRVISKFTRILKKQGEEN